MVIVTIIIISIDIIISSIDIIINNISSLTAFLTTKTVSPDLISTLSLIEGNSQNYENSERKRLQRWNAVFFWKSLHLQTCNE